MIYIIMNFESPRDKFLGGVAVICAIMLAIIVHEFAHGYVAKLNGDRTAEFSGRLTFNPAKHFDVFGVLMFLLIGFGWARPVPVDVRNFRNAKKGMVTVSLAGVGANLILAFLSAVVLSLIIAITNNLSIIEGSILHMIFFLISTFLLFSIFISVILITFNLLPIFPLDGFRLVEALTKPNNRYVVFMRRNGLYVLIGLLIFGNFLGYISPLLNPLGMYLEYTRNLLFRLLGLIFPSIMM